MLSNTYCASPHQVRCILAVKALSYYELDSESSLIAEGMVHVCLPALLEMNKKDRDLQVATGRHRLKDSAGVGADSSSIRRMSSSRVQLLGLSALTVVTRGPVYSSRLDCKPTCKVVIAAMLDYAGDR